MARIIVFAFLMLASACSSREDDIKYFEALPFTTLSSDGESIGVQTYSSRDFGVLDIGCTRLLFEDTSFSGGTASAIKIMGRNWYHDGIERSEMEAGNGLRKIVVSSKDDEIFVRFAGQVLPIKSGLLDVGQRQYQLLASQCYLVVFNKDGTTNHYTVP